MIVCGVGNSGNGKGNAKVVIIAMLYVNPRRYTGTPDFALRSGGSQSNGRKIIIFLYSMLWIISSH